MRADGTGDEPGRDEPARRGDGAPDGRGPGTGQAAGTGGGADGGVPDQAYLALERELAVFLRRARASSGEMAREVHPELESSAYGLLVRLDEAGGQRATELAGYFGVGKATVSRQLRALEDLGLIAREPDPADGRAWLVRLTDEGRDRFRRVRDARRARYVRKLSGWDRAEVAELARLLHQLNTGSDGRDQGGAPRP
ncbi:MarR family winged helix-turn-helix transcriptional regulator [Streptomyces sp. NPDC003090]|uniref:MarR family winged helix-turn-helix transcriptional regulator n=1 Tax=Streptomyces sp. NPDC003090 TaxID=3154274 RepID=UPI00381E3C0B